MKPSYLPLAQIPDGHIVVINWPEGMNIGIKASHEGTQFVAVLADHIGGGVPGPYLLEDNPHEPLSAVSLGSKWSFDFDPLSVKFNNLGRPALGTLVLNDQGPCLKCHFQNGPVLISSDGTIIPRSGTAPLVEEWKILLSDGRDGYREIYSKQQRRPAEQG